MSTISKYVIHDENDEPTGTAEYDDFQSARNDALGMSGKWAIIEREYEYSDSSMVENSEGSMIWPPEPGIKFSINLAGIFSVDDIPNDTEIVIDSFDASDVDELRDAIAEQSAMGFGGSLKELQGDKWTDRHDDAWSEALDSEVTDDMIDSIVAERGLESAERFACFNVAMSNG